MCKLVYCDYFPVVGEHHRSKHRRGYHLHSINVATSEQDIVIKWGIDKFNFAKDGFSPKFDGDILEEPFRGRGSTVIGSQGDSRWY